MTDIDLSAKVALNVKHSFPRNQRTNLSMKDSKAQESIQSSTTPVPGYQMVKLQYLNKHHKQEPRGQPFPFR